MSFRQMSICQGEVRILESFMVGGHMVVHGIGKYMAYGKGKTEGIWQVDIWYIYSILDWEWHIAYWIGNIVKGK